MSARRAGSGAGVEPNAGMKRCCVTPLNYPYQILSAVFEQTIIKSKVDSLKTGKMLPLLGVRLQRNHRWHA